MQKTSSHVLHRILPGDPRERKEHVFKTLFGREARREAHQRILEPMEYFGTLDCIVCATPNPTSVAWNMAATCGRQCSMLVGSSSGHPVGPQLYIIREFTYSMGYPRTQLHAVTANSLEQTLECERVI